VNLVLFHRPAFFLLFNTRYLFLHCKDKKTKIPNKYSQKRNCAALVPIYTFMCLRAIYIFPLSVCLFCYREICGPILGIYKSLTDTWRMNDCGHAIPFLGIHKWDLNCSVDTDTRLNSTVKTAPMALTEDQSPFP
jgi:hypothetical protein